MKTFIFLASLLPTLVFAQKHHRNDFLFADMGEAVPLSFKPKEVFIDGVRGVVNWQPSALIYYGFGGHYEFKDWGIFGETFWYIRKLNINPNLGFSFGQRFGINKNSRKVTYIELGASSRNRLDVSNTEIDGFWYGVGVRYRIWKPFWFQGLVSRKHYPNILQINTPYGHPSKFFISACLHIPFRDGTQKRNKAKKVKKLTPRQLQKCFHPISTT